MSKEGAPASPHELDRIRDIIFGAQMRDYQQQFEAIRRDLGQLQQHIDQLVAQLAEHDRNQAEALRELYREMGLADDDVRSQLLQVAHKLAGDKVEQVALGQLFIEVGTRLKQDSPTIDLGRHSGEQEHD